MNKGTKLNKKVWALFEKAGFQTQPSSQSPAEYRVHVSPAKTRKVDLYAHVPDLHVTIIGSNKSGRWKDSWTGHVDDYEQIGLKAGATKVLFVVTGKEMAEEDIEYAKAKGMCLWDEDQLAYYEAVAEAIKEYAKYEIIHALGITTTEESDIHRVLALRLRQPTSGSSTELFMFTVSPERLLRTCVIYRRAQGSADAYQRMLRKNRLPQICRFVSRPGSLLPTDIIVNLTENITIDRVRQADLRDTEGSVISLSNPTSCDLVALNIPMRHASIELIDGQHRLYGFVDTDAATKREFNLVVLGVKGLDAKQQRDTFVAINDNSRRMDPNLVSYLKYTDDDVACQRDNELMAIRIVVDLNRTTPFKNAIRLLDIGKQTITLKGFSGYDLRGLLGSRGLLRKYYPANTPDEYLRVLRMYFSIIRSTFRKEWQDPDKYIIATNRGISAFLKLLKSTLKTEKAQLTVQTLKNYLGPLKSHWKTWEFQKLRQKYMAYVGSQGWKDFHRELVKTIRRDYPNFKE